MGRGKPRGRNRAGFRSTCFGDVSTAAPLSSSSCHPSLIRTVANRNRKFRTILSGKFSNFRPVRTQYLKFSGCSGEVVTYEKPEVIENYRIEIILKPKPKPKSSPGPKKFFELGSTSAFGVELGRVFRLLGSK